MAKNFHKILTLTVEECSKIDILAHELLSMGFNNDYRSFFNTAQLYSYKLPERILNELSNFKFHQNLDSLIIRKNPYDDNDIGLTPLDYRSPTDYSLNKAEIISTLYGILLGQPFSFETQRSGHIYNRIIPSPKLANVANNSSGFNYHFDFHTEDAFHPCRADFMTLTCMRNNEQAVTQISSLRGIEIEEKYKEILFQKIFKIRNNNIHKGVSYDYGNQSILYGSKEEPFLAVNLANMDLNEYSLEVREAINWLIAKLNVNKENIILEQGDCILINNLFAVHGRAKYNAKFDGYGRWLSRAYFSYDLNKSRHFRKSFESRILQQQLY